MLITFEGIDGAGKTTQIVRLQARLEGSGREVVRVREPGGTALSEGIRALLLDPALSVDPFAELLLFSAARAQLCAEVIGPALERGAVVLADRFYDSSTAYQGAGRGVAAVEWLRGFHERVTGGIVPRRTVLLRLSPEAAEARREGQAADRMEASGRAFYARVAEAYDALAAAEPSRFLTLDATREPEGVAEAIWQTVRADLGD